VQRGNKPLRYRLFFAVHGVLPLEFIPVYSVGDLLLQHVGALEQEAEGGVRDPSPAEGPATAGDSYSPGLR
jgi:hypothetical protein